MSIIEKKNFLGSLLNKNDLISTIREFVSENKFTLLFVLGIVLMRTFLYTWYFIPSASMNPNLKEGDFVLASKLEYNFEIPFIDNKIFLGSPEHGHVVNFFYEGERFVKRVIAKEGDKIKMIDNRFYINGKELSLTRVPNKDVENKNFKSQDIVNYYAFEEVNNKGKKYQVMYSDGFSDRYAEKLITDFKEFSVPEDSFVMIGDNRNMSQDSRFIGLINQKDISSRNLLVIINIYDVWDYITGNLESIRFFEKL